MKPKKIVWIIAGIGLIALVAIRLMSNKNTTEKRVYQYDKEKAITVAVDTLLLQNTNTSRHYTGTFEPNKETRLSAETQGKINVILVDVGSYVTKGQTLIQLDNALLKLQLETIDVQISGLEADVKRFTVLAQADAIQGVQLEKATLGLKSAQIQRATLAEQIHKTTIKAPFDGIVTAKLTEVGGFAAPGVPLLQITDIHLLKFTVQVPERELHQFKTGSNYAISADAYPDIMLSGKVILVGSKSNMGNSYPIQFLVENTKDVAIKSGMFGTVKVEETEVSQGIVINASAIVGTTEQPQVYVVIDNKAVLQNISISNKFQNKALISAGLNVGDILVTQGFINLFPDANVIIK